MYTDTEVQLRDLRGRLLLSGFVNSGQVKAHIGDAAAGVSGVRYIENDLVVK
jgi:osmotically-inducible protein OsmY